MLKPLYSWYNICTWKIITNTNDYMKTTFEKDILELEESLSRYAYSLTSNRDDAKDLVQETFFKALNNQEKFSDQTNIKAWIYTIMKNTFINDYRRRTKRQTLFSSDVQEYVLNNRPAEHNPESEFSFRELTKIVNSLEPEFRVPFQMHDSGYKYQEIADELGLHLGTVKSRIHFSRQKLMEKLK
jgi:RNA polymerase sigma-70 factor (ECF subfamily)